MLLGNCRTITRIVSNGLDRSLTRGERAKVRLHLLACDGCREYQRQILALRQIALVASGRNKTAESDNPV